MGDFVKFRTPNLGIQLLGMPIYGCTDSVFFSLSKISFRMGTQIVIQCDDSDLVRG
jgi:hypothetical protein